VAKTKQNVYHVSITVCKGQQTGNVVEMCRSRSLQSGGSALSGCSVL